MAIASISRFGKRPRSTSSGSRRVRKLEELSYTFAGGAFSCTCANLDSFPCKRYCWRKDGYLGGPMRLPLRLVETEPGSYSLLLDRSLRSMGSSRRSGMSPTATFGRAWRDI